MAGALVLWPSRPGACGADLIGPRSPRYGPESQTPTGKGRLMKDPLTKREFNEFAGNVKRQLRIQYERALASGAFDPEEYHRRPDFRIVKIVLADVAAIFAPKDDRSRKDAANYAKF